MMVATERVAHCDPEIMSGAPVFVGTRVPVRNLVDCLRSGDTLEDFLKDYPTVDRHQALAALDLAGELLVAHARAA